MDTEKLFPAHISDLCQEFGQALQQRMPSASGILLHSGSPAVYYDDDQSPVFKAWGHFLRWLPVERPDQFVLFRPGARPVFFALVPGDFWHDQTLNQAAWWADCFDIVLLEEPGQLGNQKAMQDAETLVFLGEDTTLARELRITEAFTNPAALLTHLDFRRAFKTAYEVERLREANALALPGHEAARDCFQAGGDEYDIHLAYLQACRTLDEELPYPSIVALNQHAATLHYQHKQRNAHTASRPVNQVLLIDAGCRVYGYCSDITRTWAMPDVHPVFKDLLDGMQSLQSNTVASIRPGVGYGALHQQAHIKLASLLLNCGICRDASAEDLVSQGVTWHFMPHGLGHLLGLQVHDVGGRLCNEDGDFQAAPGQFPALRTTRAIAEGMVFTIEPGVYFIPMLLDKLRGGKHRTLINWPLVEALIPLGGIRIEDNVLVTGQEVVNLTRTTTA